MEATDGFKTSHLDSDYVRSVLNAIESAIVIVDMGGVIIASNRRADDLLGRGERLSGKHFMKSLKAHLIPRLKDPRPLTDWLEIVNSAFGLSLAAPWESRSCEVQLDGESDRDLVVYASQVEAPDGRRIGTLYGIYDATSLRHAERVLSAVSLAARQINSDLQVKEMLPSLYDVVRERVPLDGMAILIVKESGRTVVLGSIPEAFMGGAGASAPLPAPDPGGEVLVDIVSDIEKALATDSSEASRPLLPRSFLAEVQKEGFGSLAALPLYVPGQVVGIWVLASRQPRMYTHTDMAFLEPVAGHLATAVKNATLLESTKEMYSAAVRALAATVDIRDSYTMHHSEHVSMIAKKVAEQMGMPEDEIEVIELAGLVHDIGKVGIPDAILQKPGPLGPSERSVMTNHSLLGASILERAGMLADLAPLVLHHHEWHNGAGYPDRLNGGEIPIGAAILSVADALDTMISDRPYRPGMSLDKACEELERCAGAQFHPEVVKALIAVLHKARQRDEEWLASLIDDNAAETRKALGYHEPRTLVEQSGDRDHTISSKELDVLFRIAQEMRKLLDLPELLNHVCRIVSEEMGYSNIGILLPNETGEYLEVRAAIGLSEPTLGLKIPAGQGISWWVMANGIPQSVPDTSVDERYFRGSEGVGSELHIPLEVRGRRLGVLVIQRPEKGAFRPNDLRMLTALAGHLASAVEVAQLHEQVKKSADTDALTGLFNRRVFFTSLEACIKRAYSGDPDSLLSVVILDVDDLKDVNDRYGHLVGDAVLSRIADHLRSGFRMCDVVARYGGDEFVVLLPGASKEAAARRTEDVIKSWAGETIEGPGGAVIPLPGASFGVATFPLDGTQARHMLSVADDLLREAKQSKSAR